MDSRLGHLAPYVHRTNFTADEAKDPPNTGTEWLCFPLCIYENDRLAFAHVFYLLSIAKAQLALGLQKKFNINFLHSNVYINSSSHVTLVKDTYGCHWSLALVFKQQ